MKRILCIVCCCLLSLPVLARSWKMGSSERCFVIWDYDGVKDFFYYCGDQSKGCAGAVHGKKDFALWQGYGDSVDAGDGFDRYYCCGEKYRKAPQGFETNFTKVETKIKYVTGGKCSYIITTDACGKVNDEDDCTEADPGKGCADGYVSREGKCVELCQDGYAFKSEYSGECVKCDTTKYSGIVNGNCKQCDKATEFYDNMNKNCITKNSMNKYSSEQMAKCFMCSGDNFKTCLAGGSTGEKNCPLD